MTANLSKVIQLLNVFLSEISDRVLRITQVCLEEVKHFTGVLSTRKQTHHNVGWQVWCGEQGDSDAVTELAEPAFNG